MVPVLQYTNINFLNANPDAFTLKQMVERIIILWDILRKEICL